MKNLTMAKWNFVPVGKVANKKVLAFSDGTKETIGGSLQYTVVNETIKKNRGIAKLDIYVKGDQVIIAQTRIKNGNVLPYNHFPVKMRNQLIIHTVSNPAKVVSKKPSPKVATKVTKK